MTKPKTKSSVITDNTTSAESMHGQSQSKIYSTSKPQHHAVEMYASAAKLHSRRYLLASYSLSML